MSLAAIGVGAIVAQDRDRSGLTAPAKGDRIDMGGGNAGEPVSASDAQRKVPRALAVKAAAPRDAGPSITLLGSIPTASSALSVAIYGNLAYVCDINEVSIINISNPSSLQLVGTVSNGFIQPPPGIVLCSIQRNTLAIFTDQNKSDPNNPNNNTPTFLAFNLNNPSSPQLIAGTRVNKRFFGIPAYIGNYAFVPTWDIAFSGVDWQTQYGDLVSVDLTNFAAPQVVNTLEQPQVDPTFGGATVVMGSTQADASLLYVGGSTSTLGPGARFGYGNLGTGRLQVVDVSNPTAMNLVGQLLVPGTKQLAAPQIQGTVAVAIGNSGGFTGSSSFSNTFAGNVVVATFDVSDRRQPAILSITTTSFKPASDGSYGTRIGNNLFAFPGVNDANNNPVLLIVNATSPQAPAIASIPLTQGFTSVQAVGSILYATSASGLAAYSIPGINNIPLSVCPAIVDTALVLDRGAVMPAQAFLDAKAALKTFIDSLHLPSDHVAVASFTTSATVNQTLTPSSALAKSAFDGIVAGGTSYIGAGIAAAQAELTGPNHNPAAFQVMIVLSDGSDRGAPNPNASAAAAVSAQAAGIRIISLQYGSTPNALMQSIASSAGDYHLVGQ